ncbi:9639_t:CDS:2, partial [Racocetra persica]
IDLDELINERMKFNKELDKIEAIERAIKALEKEVIKYKKVELKEIEIHCQQIKKELSQHQNDLLLLTDTDEEKGLLKEKIIDLKKELREVEQKNHDISQQLIKTNVVLFSQQIKNLNLGSKVNQSWTATCECAKNCICEGKLSREMVENNNSKGKVKEAESQVKDEQYEEQIEVSPYQKK